MRKNGMALCPVPSPRPRHAQNVLWVTENDSQSKELPRPDPKLRSFTDSFERHAPAIVAPAPAPATGTGTAVALAETPSPAPAPVFATATRSVACIPNMFITETLTLWLGAQGCGVAAEAEPCRPYRNPSTFARLRKFLAFCVSIFIGTGPSQRRYTAALTAGTTSVAGPSAPGQLRASTRCCACLPD